MFFFSCGEHKKHMESHYNNSPAETLDQDLFIQRLGRTDFFNARSQHNDFKAIWTSKKQFFVNFNVAI